MRPFDILPGNGLVALVMGGESSRWIGAAILCVLLSFVVVLSVSLKRKRRETESVAEIPSQKIDWQDYMLGIAFMVSRRSPDNSTKHGTVICNPKHHIIACGYNGFVRGVDETSLQNTKAGKHKNVIHSEINALHNKTSPLLGDETAYVTGFPCFDCVKNLIQAGIRNIIVADRRGLSNPPPNQFEDVYGICEETGTNFTIIKPNLNWMYDQEFQEELRNLGFIN